MNTAKDRQCSSCGNWMPERFWQMTKARKAAVHVMATKKGLIERNDSDLYLLRLSRMGLTSSTQMKRQHFKQFMAEVGALADV